MSKNTAEFILKFQDLVSGGLTKINSIATGTEKKIDSLAGSFKKFEHSTFIMNQVTQGVQNFNSALQDITAPGKAFETSMAEVQAITGLTDAEMVKIKDSARGLAKTFGGEAAEEGAVFTKWLSDMNPELAKNEVAMNSLGITSNTLAKNMRGDMEAATGALTTMLNQFKVNDKDPMAVAAAASQAADVLTVAARIGNAEVTDLAASVKVAGNSAYNAGINLQTTAAAIEVIGKGSKKGAEAGVGLRNILGQIGKGAEYMEEEVRKGLEKSGVNISKMSDKTVPLATRLRELSKISDNTGLMIKMFGQENVDTGLQLLKNIPLLEEYQSKMGQTGVNADMASIQMGTFDEKMGRLTGKFKDIGISIFDATKEYLPFVQFSAHAADLSTRLATGLMWIGRGAMFMGKQIWKATVNSIIPFIGRMAVMGVQALITGGRFVITGLMMLASFIPSVTASTIAMFALNAVMLANPIGLIILGIMALVGAIVLVVKYWDVIKSAVIAFGEFLLKYNVFSLMFKGLFAIFPGFKKFMVGIWDWIKNLFSKLWEGIKWIVEKVKAVFNLDVNLSDPGGLLNGFGDFTLDNKGGGGDGKKKGAVANSSITGESKSRISVVRIGKIEVNNRFDGGEGLAQNAQKIGDQIVNEILSAVYDMQKTLISG